jgi:hypothetical protein
MEIDRPGQSDDDIDVRLEWPSDPLASDPPAPRPPKPAREAAPALPTTSDDDDAAATLRALIGAYEQLGDRLLGRLRDLRDGVDTDLATVRSELAQVTRDVAGVRADLAGLLGPTETREAPVAGPAGSIGEGLAEALEPLVEEVAGLRTEVASLRRRISLRANDTPVELSDDQLQRIVIAISTHLSAGGPSSPQARAR